MTPPTRLTLTYATAQGARSHQEDRFLSARLEIPHLQNGQGHLLAVFDGHGGAETSEKASGAAKDLFQSALRSQNGDSLGALHEMFHALVRDTQTDTSGSTAAVVYLPDRTSEAFVGVLGDSFVAIRARRGKFWCSPDHNVRSNIQERQAAIGRGGAYIGGYIEDAALPGTGLQMARALGDRALAHVLSRTPDIVRVGLDAKSAGLLGTDGLFEADFGSPAEKAGRLMQMIAQGADAQAVIDDALRRGISDNVTAIVWTRRAI